LKKILIITPHFPPSNLASVHRSRLFAKHLPSFGWEPIILTVNEQYYEEEQDEKLLQLLSPSLTIEKVKAFPLTRPRLIGDLGLRAFFQLYNRAKKLIKHQGICFVYIPIPSFYCALLGRWLHATTGVQYGIDYIDPWVHYFPGSNKLFSRHWFSTKLSGILEPIAIKHVSLITGVAEGYYKDVLQRNPQLKQRVITGAMPYGGEYEDHVAVGKINCGNYLFQKNNKIQLVYAGAMLPKAYLPLKNIFESIRANSELFKNVEIHFIGTGKTAGDAGGFNIKPMAEEYGLWQKQIFEYPKRIPYLDVLCHLNLADGIFILGSTEPHYTPSKVYQALLSNKPMLAVLHSQSSAVGFLLKSNAGVVTPFDGEKGAETLRERFPAIYMDFQLFIRSFRKDQVEKSLFSEYSAKAVTEKLACLLNEAVK